MNEKDFFERFIYDSEKDILGSGGFGSVYRAYDRLKNRYIAIKISQVKDIFGKFTLLNEVKLSQEIDDHANVARYEFGLRVKHPFPVDYAVMAYYEEGNLDMVLRKKQGILTAQEQYEIVEGLLEGINHLHTENVIHRDLKLANILMHRTKQGHWRPKIADFGLSRQMDTYDSSIANSAIGITIAYAAPEQIENKPIRKNVDLWALGVIIYRILTGDMPFAPIQGAEPTSATVEMSRKITQVELPERLDTLPEPYQTIIRRCWVKDIKDRAQSAAELLDILRNRKPPAILTASMLPAEDTQATFEREIPNEEISETLILPNESSAQVPAVPPSVFDTKSASKTTSKTVPPVEEATILESSFGSSDDSDNTDKTVIDPNSLQNRAFNNKIVSSSSGNSSGNKSKIFIGAGLLCLLLGFVFWYNKTPKTIPEPSTTTQIDAPITPVLPDNNKPIAPISGNNTPTTNPTNVPLEPKKAVESPTSSPAPVKTASRRPSGPVDKAGDFVLKLSCCCHELTGGTIRIQNFIIESDGRVSTTSNTRIKIVNNGTVVTESSECREKILSVFKKFYRWSSHGGGYYTMDDYEIEY